MPRLTFHDEIVAGRIDDLELIVSPTDQDKFCKRIRTEFRKKNGNISSCFEWGWRCFKTMRSLLFSALLYVESKRAQKDKYPDAIYCYSLYYSLFHASFSLLCMHPQIQINHLMRISHSQLMKLVENKFVQTGVLPDSFTKSLEKLKVVRELTSYFAPLGGLETTSVPDIKDVNSTFDGAKKNLAYSFQLCNLLGSIYWKVKQNCIQKNKAICKEKFRLKGEEIGDNIEQLISYPPFDSAKYWSFIGTGYFDNEDAHVAVRKFGLFDICPTPLLQYLTLEVGTEAIKIENDEAFKEFLKFIEDIW
jgi:uncharacterized protein (UPF0332 family)